MEKDFAIPVWADPVRITDEPPKENPLPFVHRLDEKKHRFVKRYAVAILAILAFAVWSVLICCITGTIVRRNTRLEDEHHYRAQMQAYLEEQEQQRMASSLVTGEKSRQAAIDLESREIARVLYGVKDNSEADLRTTVWCILNRVDNAGYPSNVYMVCAQSQQWMGYSPENPVLDNLVKIAKEELETWYSGTRPCDSTLVYLNWTPSKITLRDNWNDGSSTTYWRWGK